MLLFHLDHSRFKSKLVGIDFELRRAVFMMNALRPLGGNNAIRIIAERSLPVARYYQRTAICIELLTELRSSAAFESDEYLYNKYDSELSTLADRYASELYAEGSMSWLQVKFAGSGDDHPELAPEAEARARKLWEMYQLHGTLQLGKAYFDLAVKAAQMRRDHARVRELLEFQRAFYDDTPHLVGKTQYVQLQLVAATSTVHTREPLETEKILSAIRDDLPVGHALWFSFKETEFYHLTIEQRFSEAYDTLLEVKAEARFSSLPEAAKRRWALFEILNRYQRDQKMLLNSKDPVDALLWKTPKYRADESGYRVTLLILQLLVHLREGNEAKVNELVDVLRAYRDRRLRKKTHPQTVAMLNFLIVCAKLKLELGAVMAGPYPALKKVLESEPPDGILEDFLPLKYITLADMVIASLAELKPDALEQPSAPHWQPLPKRKKRALEPEVKIADPPGVLPRARRKLMWRDSADKFASGGGDAGSVQANIGEELAWCAVFDEGVG